MTDWLVPLAIALLVAVALTALWLSWTAGRLDRLHLRVEAARASLVSQLQRRASVATELAIGGLGDPASSVALLDAARTAREAEDASSARWRAESELTAVLRSLDLSQVQGEPLVDELTAAARQAALARRIHNDVAAATIGLHQRRRVRWFRLAGRAAPPDLIEFDDRVVLSDRGGIDGTTSAS